MISVEINGIKNKRTTVKNGFIYKYTPLAFNNDNNYAISNEFTSTKNFHVFVIQNNSFINNNISKDDNNILEDNNTSVDKNNNDIKSQNLYEQ